MSGARKPLLSDAETPPVTGTATATSTTTTTTTSTGSAGAVIPGTLSASAGIGRTAPRAGYGYVFIVCFVACVCVASVVVLSLPETWTCFKDQATYYKEPVAPLEILESYPPAICTPGSTLVTLKGSGFIKSGGDSPLLSIAGYSINGSTLINCTKAPVRWQDVYECDGIQFSIVLPSTPKTLTLPLITVVNPTPPSVPLASAQDGTCKGEAQILSFFPPPIISDYNPPAICQHTTHAVVVTGKNFVSFDGVKPTVTLSNMLVSNTSLSSCLNITVPGFLQTTNCSSVKLIFAADDYTSVPTTTNITVTNPPPAACTTSTTSGSISPSFLILSQPSILSATPSITCVTTSVNMKVTGSGFYVIDNVNPTLKVGGVTTNIDSVSSCTYVLSGKHQIRSCNEFRYTAPVQTLSNPTQPSISVTNPAGLSDCFSTNTGVVTYVPPPTLTSASPAEVCAALSPQTVTLSGSFLSMSTTTPSLTVHTSTVPTTLSQCTNSTVGQYTASTCRQMAFSMPALSVYGNISLSVTSFCGVTTSSLLRNVPSSTISAIRPPNVCVDASTKVVLTGTNFAVDRTANPTLKFGSVSGAINAMGGCVYSTTGFQLCTSINSTVVASSLGVGVFSVTVANGQTVSCETTKTNFLEVVPHPSVTNWTTQYCENEGGEVTLWGTGFSETWSTITLISGGSSFAPSSITSVTSTKILMNFYADSVPAGVYDIVVNSAESCSSVTAGGLSVNANIIVLWYLDPPFVYNNVSTIVTLYTTGLESQVEEVVFTASEYTLTFLNVTLVTEGDYNVFSVVIPKGVPPATYDVVIRSPNTCHAVGSVSFLVSNNTTPTSTVSVSPSSISTLSSSTIELVASDSSYFNSSHISYIYLLPCEECNLVQLYYVTFVSPAKVSVTLPSGVESGVYDIVVVRSDGGVLTAPLNVLAYALPSVSRITPTTISNSTTVTIFGTFGNITGVKLVLQCDLGDTYTDNTIARANSTTIIAVVSTSPAPGSTCIMSLSFGDGTSCSYNSLAYVLKSRYLFNWKLEASLPQPICGVSTSTASIGDRTFMYVLGGDTTTACQGAGAVNSVYVGELDPFGRISSWRATTNLTSPVSFGTANNVGQYLYFVGGYKDATSSNQVLKVHLLNPSEQPQLTASLSFADTSSLLPGLWVYQVAAVYSSANAANPGGESLPSEKVSVYVPDTTNSAVLLNWTSCPDATSYRIYRTAAASTPTYETLYLASTVSTSFVDSGYIATNILPHKIGDLGSWITDLSMEFPRWGHSTAIIKGSSNQYLISVFGGSSLANTIQANYESTRISIVPATKARAPEVQQMSAWSQGSRTMTHLTFRESVVLTYDEMASYGSSDQVILLGSGFTGSDLATTHTYNHYSDFDFYFEPWPDVTTGLNRAAYCLFVSDGMLYALGGKNGTNQETRTCLFMKLGTSTPPSENPITNYNDLRYCPQYAVSHPGCATGRGNFFMLGGKSGTALLSTVQSVPA